MTDIINSIFNNKKADFKKLNDFGFHRENSIYMYTLPLKGSDLLLTVSVNSDGCVSSQIIDTALNEPYTLHLAAESCGSFVGSVKEQYEHTLTEISEHCFYRDVFKALQSKRLIEYIRTIYGDEPEFLWKKFDNNAVCRRSDNKKWYCALLTVSKCKLGINSEGIAEVVDFRVSPDTLEKIIDRKKYFPGYHMNKKHWATVILDNSVSDDELFKRIDDSHCLALK